MAAATSTSYAALLKEVWPQEDVWELTLQNNVLFGIIEKDTAFYETVRHIALTFGMTQGVGGDFASAKANKSPSSNAQFAVTTTSYYSLFSVSRKVIKQSQNKRGAILSALERESKMALSAWKRDMGFFLYRNGGGAMGTVSSFTGTTVVLTNVNDVRMFEKNMWLQFSVDDGTGGAGVRLGQIQVTAVTRSTGTLTFASTAPIIGLANGDSIFRVGNYNNVIQGLNAWVPSNDPSATLFFGLNRSVDTDRLGGLRVSATTLSPREAAQKAAMALFAVGFIPDTYMLHTSDFQNLQLELQSSGLLMNIKEPASEVDDISFGVTYQGIEMAGPGGPIQVFPDYNCQPSVGWMLTRETWKIGMTGDVPYLDNEDGTPILRESDADSYEGRWVGDLQPYCEAPGGNARVALA